MNKNSKDKGTIEKDIINSCKKTSRITKETSHDKKEFYNSPAKFNKP